MTGEGTARSDGETATVLVVDDEPRVCQAFELWLSESYGVETATDGETALALLDGDVDVILLDRHMPGLSGDEVLERIREGAHDPRVAMVTAVDPDFDIVEMPFDHYVSKPVDGSELEAVIEQLLELDQYDDHVTDLYGVTEKIVTLEAEKTRSALADSDEYAALVDRRERLEAEMADIVASMDDEGIGRLFDVATGDDG
ncbi:response regulator [Haloplanus natans]|uniref:response regulator n=1 Tax=Haloplanus natans TaxID=376171 RepID=UPI0006780A4D|nr:response regulator [Haloplanus natans]